MSDEVDLKFMKQAIVEAQKGAAEPGGAEVGCVITWKDELAAAGHNEAELRCDPTAHAEMVTIRRLCAKLQRAELKGYTLYCTLQPCGMCSMACVWAGISRIVYGATRSDVNSVYFESRHADTVDYLRNCFRDDIEIEGGVMKEECSALYLPKAEPANGLTNPAHEPTEQPG
jgi:tRNA(adenine34) deaminase